MSYIYLALAILTEVIATSALRATAEFTKFWPSLLVISGYALSFYFLTLTLRSIPMGITYAVWSGIGIVLVTVAGVVFYKQTPDLPAVIGMALIISGVIVIHLYSNMKVH
ncbi:MAG: multidrug efflux SMR transporter [Gammaproteobacteria bacterium]|nr:multidrug efflux SMR transporter [Gammaproteobacteria bacterium]